MATSICGRIIQREAYKQADVYSPLKTSRSILTPTLAIDLNIILISPPSIHALPASSFQRRKNSLAVFSIGTNSSHQK